ncbi:BRISC and BRCA1-A complex member 1 [Quillaja saponaria]|uniref:BRISC and BRCA1-A complex member 1 n=1 Tax=Quillaja saponaria TaxID=32244 RepID=A0AAD7LY64_QUISA|nr:BRISC and BRCA1-A complex member 1 [Quillaja saponaria]
MEVMRDDSSAVTSRYTLTPSRICNEDTLFCIAVDPESLSEMNATAANGRPITRLDSIKQAILLFVNGKLTINPKHRFAFTILGKSASWLQKEFSNEFESAVAAVQELSAATSSCGQADLTNLFRVAAHEAKKNLGFKIAFSEWFLFTADHLHYHSINGLWTKNFSLWMGYNVYYSFMCVLLSHPQQRCAQDYIDIPKSLLKKTRAAEPMATEDVPVSSQ